MRFEHQTVMTGRTGGETLNDALQKFWHRLER
jgi:hypothetical protein